MTATTTDEAAARLRRILGSFDISISELGREERAILLMALRGIDIYRELDAVADRAPNVSMSGLRSLIDLAILVKWIEPCRKLRLAMWSADDDRDRLRMARGPARLLEERGHGPHPGLTQAQEQRMRSRIERIRKIAMDNGQQIRSKRGETVLPTTKTRSEEEELSEAGFTFLALSLPSHSSGRAFAKDERVRRSDGFHFNSQTVFDGSGILGLAVPATCLLLASVSRQLGLGLEGDLDAIRDDTTAWTQP